MSLADTESNADIARWASEDWLDLSDDERADADEALRLEAEAVDAAAWDARSAQEREHAALELPGRYATADEYYGVLTADPAYLDTIPWAVGGEEEARAVVGAKRAA